MLPRLRVLISISATLAISGGVEAVEMGNIEVQSAINEPFRAKIPLKKISYDVSRLSVSSASRAEYGSLGMIQNNVKLNYKLQDNGNGTGTLWIDSKQPVTEPFLDIVLNVTDNNQIQQHKVSALINPSSLKGLKRKKVNTQSSNNVNKLLAGQEVVIQPINSAPPPLMSTSNASVNLPVTTRNQGNQNINDLISQNHSGSPSGLKTKDITDSYGLPNKIDTKQSTVYAKKTPSAPQTAPLTKAKPTNTRANNNSYKNTSAFPNFDDSIIDRITAENRNSHISQPKKPNKAAIKKPKKQQTKKTTKPKKKAVTTRAKSKNSSRYSVVKRDTLWGIANKVSRKKKIPLNQLMDDIVASNPNAFVNNNPNKLKSGVTLVIPNFSASQTASDGKKPFQKKRKTAVVAKKSSKTKKPTQNKSKNKTVGKSKPSKTKSYQAKKPIKNTQKLKSSEMRIVAKKGQGNAQGEASTAKNSKSKLPPRIISQIQKSRKATIAKRKRINKLNTELRSFDQKLKVQNTKLAELEARLKQLQAKNSKKQ